MGKKSSTEPKITPLGDRVLIEEIEEKNEKTASGIILPDSANQDKETKKGKVVSVGQGKHEDGKLVPVAVQPGDFVIYSWGETIKVSGKEYILVRESDISAIIS